MTQLCIIEPSFLSRSGHVEDSLREFIALSDAKNIHILVPRGAPTINFSNSNVRVHHILPNTYSSLILGTMYSFPTQKIFRFISHLFLPLRMRGNFNRRLAHVVLFIRSYFLTTRSLRAFFTDTSSLDIRVSDTNFLIVSLNADCLTSFAVIRLIRRYGNRVSLRLRFIGVLENFRLPYIFDMSRLLKILNRMHRQGFGIEIAAETSR